MTAAYGTTVEYSCDEIAQRLLLLTPRESLLLYSDAGTDPRVLAGLLDAFRERGHEVQHADLSQASGPVDAEALLDRALTAGPRAAIELTENYYYAAPATGRFLAGGGRVLALGNLSLDALERCVAAMDSAVVRAFGASLYAILLRARRVEIRSGTAASLCMDLTPQTTHRIAAALRGRARSRVFIPSPIPLFPAQMAFLPGQLSFLGSPSSINGSLTVDSYFWPPGTVKRLQNVIELKVRRGVVVDIRGGTEAARVRDWLGARDRTVQHFCIGFHPGAQLGDAIVEAERVYGTLTIGFGAHPFHTDGVCARVELLIDGVPLMRDGAFVHPALCSEQARIRSEVVPVVAPPMHVELAQARGPLARTLWELGRARHVRILDVRRYSNGQAALYACGEYMAERMLASLCVGRSATPTSDGTVRAPQFYEWVRTKAASAGMMLMRVHALLGRWAELDRIALRVPSFVVQGRSLVGLRQPLYEHLANSRNRDDLRRLRKAGLTGEWHAYERKLFERFYGQYYAPTMRMSHGEFAGLADFGAIRQVGQGGELLSVRDGNDVVAMGLFTRRGQALILEQFGVWEGDADLNKRGAVAGIYYFGIERGVELGLREITYGRAVPVLSDGVIRYKAKWGGVARPVHEPWQPMWMVPNPRHAATLDMLTERPLAFLAGRRLVGLAMLRDTTPAVAEAALKQLRVPGVDGSVVILPPTFGPGEHGVLEDLARRLNVPCRFLRLAGELTEPLRFADCVRAAASELLAMARNPDT